MLKKFLATASVVGLIAGAANALEVDAVTVAAPAGSPTVLAADLDYAGGAVSTSAVPAGELQFRFYPTGGTFPTGNVVMRVVVSGAEFASGLTGSEVTTPAPGTSVVSSGGVAGGSEVVFLLSDVSTCAAGNCFVDLPLDLTSGDVSVQVGLQTDAGVPIDNSSSTNLVSAVLSVSAPAFSATVTPSITDSEATLASLFTVLSVDGILGTVEVAPNVVNVGTVAAPVLVTVQTDPTALSPVGLGDVASIGLEVEGVMDAFDPVVAPAGGSFTVGALTMAVDSAADTATATGAALSTVYTVTATPDATSAIQRSDYAANIVVNVAPASPLTAGATFSGDLQSITREGTEITFPWTQTATQGNASGVSSVFRIGNLGASDTGAVFGEVRNASEAGFVNPGIVQLAPSIDGNGEFVINSANLEAALGNYGRGDVNFIVEARDTALTGRQFVVRNGVIQQVIGGTVSQDQN